MARSFKKNKKEYENDYERREKVQRRSNNKRIDPRMYMNEDEIDDWQEESE